MICSGCIHAPLYDNQGNVIDNRKCPFCRMPFPLLREEVLRREKKRVELDDPIAIHENGVYHNNGEYGHPQDYKKALELYHRSAKLGYAHSYASIGYLYDRGRGVERDRKKALYYYELGAMGGNAVARYNLGIEEKNTGNMDRALRHFMIAVNHGYVHALKKIRELYSNGHATKEDYTKALQAYQEYLSEVKSPQRDEAAVYNYEKYRYYK